MAANFAEIGRVGKSEAYFQNKIRFLKRQLKVSKEN